MFHDTRIFIPVIVHENKSNVTQTRPTVQTDVSLLCKFMYVSRRLMAGSVRRTAEGYDSGTCNVLQAKWSIIWLNHPQVSKHKGSYEFASTQSIVRLIQSN